MTLNISIREFSIIVESLNKLLESVDDENSHRTILENLINKLDEQGLSQVME